jgi:hypothetical protein
MKKLFLLLLLFPGLASADYLRTGPAYGEDCGYTGMICSKYKIEAVSKKKDTNLFTIATNFKRVERRSAGTCYVKAGNSAESGFFGKLVDGAFGNYYYSYENGKYIHRDIELLWFKCVKD